MLIKLKVLQISWVDEGGAADALSNFLPGLLDKASSGGNLLDKVGGLGGLAGMAKKFF